MTSEEQLTKDVETLLDKYLPFMLRKLVNTYKLAKAISELIQRYVESKAKRPTPAQVYPFKKPL